MRTRIGSLLTLVYLIVGLFVAHSHKYFLNVNGLRSGVSAALAVLLWPLLYFGVNLHIH
jgi:hypothetical protein